MAQPRSKQSPPSNPGTIVLALLSLLALFALFIPPAQASLPPNNDASSVADSLDPAKSVSYAYDANGNQISKTSAGATTELSYDARNRLSRVTRGGSLLASFAYDAEGRRREKTGLTGRLKYVYDGDSVLLETDELGSTVARYASGPGRLHSIEHIGEGRLYYHQDALGSTVNLTTSAGTIQATYRLDAWGSLRRQLGGSYNARLFTGKERDVETGLYDFGARYYDPEVGRFLTEDPYQGDPFTPPSLHRYLYAYGNPARYIDPTGRIVEDLFREAALEAEGLTYADLFDAGGVIEGSLERSRARIEREGTVEERVMDALVFWPVGLIGLKEAMEREAQLRAEEASLNPVTAPFKAMGRDAQRTANLIGNLARSLALTAAVAGLEWASPGVSARVFTEAERAEAFVNIILGVSGGASLARQSARMVVEEARGPILAALATQVERAGAEALPQSLGAADGLSLAARNQRIIDTMVPEITGGGRSGAYVAKGASGNPLTGPGPLVLLCHKIAVPLKYPGHT
ncbi:MAG: RHS repeat-associated core domain-containing protein, partial [Nitrospirota bacterium]